MYTFTIFGDSVLRGMYREADYHRKIWNNEIWVEKIKKDCGIQIINHSQIGCTVDRCKMLLSKALENNLKTDAILFEFGGNDSDYQWKNICDDPYGSYEANVPEDKYMDVYAELIATARSHNINVFIAIPAPIEHNNYFNFLSNRLDGPSIDKWLIERSTMYRYEEMYAFMALKTAYKYSCPFVDLRKPFLKLHNMADYFSPDGLHPTPEGHELIWKELYDFFDSLAKQNFKYLLKG